MYAWREGLKQTERRESMEHFSSFAGGQRPNAVISDVAATNSIYLAIKGATRV